MTHDEAQAKSTNVQRQLPDLALKRLERLVGVWEIRGRTLAAPEVTITGRVTIAWLPGEFFLEQRGEMTVMGQTLHSLEIVGYDPATQTFISQVYSSLNGVALTYYWDVQGDVVTHWTAGAKYTGVLSADGTTLTGGWRPDAETASSAGNAYDAIMTREA